MKDIVLIKNIEDIKEINIPYTTKESYKSRWFEISKDSDGYYIYGYVSGDTPTFPIKGQYVHYWKTFQGVIKAIKRWSEDGSWGFGNIFSNKI